MTLACTPAPAGAPLRRACLTRAERSLYDRFRSIALHHAGIELKDGKEALIAARVAKRWRALGLASAPEYLERLEADAAGHELVHFLDVISTNVTSFFREPDHFELLSTTATAWLQAGERRLRVWTAASSSGEEAWSIAMTLADLVGSRPVDYKVLGSDLSTAMLARARAGRYRGSALDVVSRQRRARYFAPVPEEPGVVRVRDELQAHVCFRRLNLSRTPFPLRGPLDFIFCRNVTMYLGRTVRQRLLVELERLLRPGGFLLIGHAETLLGLETSLRMVRPSVFVKEPACTVADEPARTPPARARRCV